MPATAEANSRKSIQKKPTQLATWIITKSSAIGQMMSRARMKTNMGKYRLRPANRRVTTGVGRISVPGADNPTHRPDGGLVTMFKWLMIRQPCRPKKKYSRRWRK